MSAPLTWGQRVTVNGRVGQYEGIFTAERPTLLRVRFVSAEGWGGVAAVERDELAVMPEHPVCVRRRLKKAGIRAPQPERCLPTPPCYLKDYGPTAAERAFLAWEAGLESGDPETFRSLWDDMQRAHFDELVKRPLRRLRPELVAQRRETAGDRRWLRTRKALRALANVTRSPA